MPDQLVQDWIANVRSKAKGRTRYEGQEPYQDETVVAYIDQLEREIAEARAEVERLRDRVERRENAWLVGAPHSKPGDCPSYYDGCHCTVEALERVTRLSWEYREALARAEAVAAARAPDSGSTDGV